MVNHCLLMLCIRSKRVYRGLFLSVDPFLRTIFYFFDLHGCILASAGSGDTLFLSQTRKSQYFGSGRTFFFFQTRVASFFSSFSFFSSTSRVWNSVFPLSDPKITIFRICENVFPLPDPHGKGTTPFPTILIPNR